MESDEHWIHPELVSCPACQTELELDEAESNSQKFTCPECGAKVEVTDPPISKMVQEMIRRRKIRIDLWDRIAAWAAPVMMCAVACMSILIDRSKSPYSVVLSAVIMGIAMFYFYRAIVSDRLTFISSIDPITRKIAIIRTLQERYGWELIRAKNGYFSFYKRNFGFSPLDIKIICTHDGYYLNCWVDATRGVPGVSIFKTIELVKAIDTLSDQYASLNR